MKLTISMATFDDFDGVYFTIQSLRMYHDLKDVEFLVLNNNPIGPHAEALKHFLKAIPNARYIEVSDRKSSWVKYDVFKYATGDIILGLDCHVLLVPGFIEALFRYFQDDGNKLNMLTGPLVYTDLRTKSSCLKPVWNNHDFGTWNSHPKDKSGQPFEIDMQGMACFAMRKDAWRPIPTTFKGFGAEEWFMAEHVRRGGGKVVCESSLAWNHRFGWPKRTFPLKIEDKITNYYIGWLDLYESMDHPMIKTMTEHWGTQITQERLDTIISTLPHDHST